MVSGINNYQANLYANNEQIGQKSPETMNPNNRANLHVLQNDSVSFSGSDKNSEAKSEKVSFGEGIKLIGKGFINKVRDIGKSIIEHPLKTLALVGGTTLALAALPLIGITAATGGAVLALGFAAYASVNTAKDVVKTIKHNKEGDYDAVRQDLQNIGGDGVDLALSLPFVPKAINQVKRYAKYGTSTFGINKELIANLRNAKNINDVSLEFAKAKTLIDYEMVGNEMGLSVKPKIVFKDLPVDPNKAILAGAYEPTTAELQINKNMLIGKGKLLAKMTKVDMEAIIRHELEHYRQFSDIARTEGIGIEGLSNTIIKYYNKMEEIITPEQMETSGISHEVVKNMLYGDKSAFNREFYQQVIDSRGTISAGTSEAELAKQYAQGLIEKVNPKPEDIAAFNEACSGLNQFNPFDQKKIQKAQLEMYKKNILEKEAFNVQDIFYNKNIKMRPGIITNNAEVLSAANNEHNEIV